MTTYIYKIETNEIAETFETQELALESYKWDYDQDLYGVTSSPAFGANDGLI